MPSGLITKRTNMVAVIISNLTDLYYPEVLAEVTRRMSDRGVRVLLFTLAAESDVDATLDQVWRYRVDGAIVAARLLPETLPGARPIRMPFNLSIHSAWRLLRVATQPRSGQTR